MVKKILLITLVIAIAILVRSYFQDSVPKTLESNSRNKLRNEFNPKSIVDNENEYVKRNQKAASSPVDNEFISNLDVKKQNLDDSPLNNEPAMEKDLSFDNLFNTFYDDIMDDESVSCCKSSIENLEVLNTTYKVKVLNKLKKGNLSDDSGATRGVFLIKYSDNGSFISPEVITFYNQDGDNYSHNDNVITLNSIQREKLKSKYTSGVLRIPPLEGISAFFSGPAGLTLMGHVSASDVIDVDIKDSCSEFLINPIRWVRGKKEYIGVMFCKKVNSKKFIKTDMVSVSIMP